MENSKTIVNKSTKIKLGAIKERKSRNQQERIEKIKNQLENIILKLLLYSTDQIEIPYQYQNDVDQYIEEAINQKLIQVDIYLDKIQRFNQEKKQFKIQQSSKVNIKKEEKPQDIYFKDKIDNSVELPFIPKLQTKYCQKYPLSNNIKQAQQNSQKFFNFIDNPSEYKFENPYEKEIKQLQPVDLDMIKDILSSIYTKERIMGSNFEFVSNSQQLLNLINHLESQIIFAVDLEHHNIRSFQGFTCLMQITTKKRDYIVDTIILRNELHQLNKVFANENIIKLFHGSQSDMLWLQKDFGIYTVNLFDTYILAKTFRRNNSLANFLQEFCGVISDKSNQITDWRIRPLTEDQLEYARMDTHYLFWVLDELIKQFYDFYQQQKQMNTDFQEYQSIDDFFAKVFWDMQKLALETYKKPNIFSKGFQKLYQQKQLEENWTEQQLQKFKHIWEWRNLRARQFDESENYILRTRDLIEICQRQVSEKHLKDLQQKKYLDSQHFHKFIQFLQQNDYIQKTSEQVGQFVHKEQDIILDEQKEDKKNIVLEKLNQLKLRNINQQHKYDIQFKINDQTQDYQSELTQQALQTMQNQQLQKILDYSQFQLETEKKQKQENRQEDLSQSFSDSEQVIMIDDQNSNVNNKALNGIELLQNLQQLNISSGIKKNLIDNFYQNQQKQSKPSKDKEIQPDQIQQEIHNISKQIKSNNNIKFDKGLFNNKKQNTRDKSKKLRKKKKSNGKNFFQQI